MSDKVLIQEGPLLSCQQVWVWHRPQEANTRNARPGVFRLVSIYLGYVNFLIPEINRKGKDCMCSNMLTCHTLLLQHAMISCNRNVTEYLRYNIKSKLWKVPQESPAVSCLWKHYYPKWSLGLYSWCQYRCYVNISKLLYYIIFRFFYTLMV